MSLEEDIDAVLADPETMSNVRGLTNVVVYSLDQHTTKAPITIATMAWALSRLCHKLGVSREYMHELVTLGYDYSCINAAEETKDDN